MRRREVLAAAGTAAAAGLAGCLGLGPCAGAPNEPRRLVATVRDDQRVTLQHDGCPTLRDPALHYTALENRRGEPVTAGVGVDLLDGGTLFRGEFRLAPDASVIVERPDPDGYTVTVGIPALDWHETHEEPRDSYTCNEMAQQVVVGPDGVDTRVTRTTLGCDSLVPF